MRRVIGCLCALLVLGGGPLSISAAEVLLYRGQFVYVIPEIFAAKMLEVAGRDDWRHDAADLRRIDVDGDGASDFIAIGLGSSRGFGAQVRYRLRGDDSKGGEIRIGRWYWGVLTGPDGARLHEIFNR